MHSTTANSALQGREADCADLREKLAAAQRRADDLAGMLALANAHRATLGVVAEEAEKARAAVQQLLDGQAAPPDLPAHLTDLSHRLEWPEQ